MACTIKPFRGISRLDRTVARPSRNRRSKAHARQREEGAPAPPIRVASGSGANSPWSWWRRCCSTCWPACSPTSRPIPAGRTPAASPSRCTTSAASSAPGSPTCCLSGCGYVAYLLPLVLGVVAWIALFGLDPDGDGDVDLGPALRLIGIVGFLVSATGLLQLRVGRGRRPSAGSGGILGQVIGRSLYRGFGPSAATCSCSPCCMVSVTLATGLSLVRADGLASAGWCWRLGPLFRRRTQEAGEWQRTRDCARSARKCARSDSERRAKREPVRIEPPAPALIEKSDRAQREQQIPLFNVGDDTGFRRCRCSTIPSRSRRATPRKPSRRCRGRSNSSSRISASTRRWSAPIRAR